MIFPLLHGILSPLRAPATFILLAINLVIFAVTYTDFQTADQKMEDLIKDESFLATQGMAFAVMIDREPKLFSQTLQQLAAQALHSNSDSRQMLGSMALRNWSFMSRAGSYDFGGDQIALAKWKETFSEFKELVRQHPSFQWGMMRGEGDWRRLFTYQFAHSGGMHLFWNMVFLLLFGCFIEASFSRSVVLFTYIGAGLAGAFAFSLMSGLSSSPLVGASGAVSGLMGLVAFKYWNQRTLRFFYWLLPMRGYFGFILLPGWVVLIVSLIPDLSGFLAASHDFGSVAYSAHIGGAFFGALMAVALTLADPSSGSLKSDQTQPTS